MKLRLTACGVAITALTAAAQNPPSPYSIPGTVVGRPSLAPVGVAFPKVGTQTGTPIGYQGPNGQPVNTGQRPAGQVIDLTNLAAPISAPLPADLAGSRPRSFLERQYDKWKDMLGFTRPTTQPANFYVPGLSRRNRDRHKEEMRRD